MGANVYVLLKYSLFVGKLFVGNWSNSLLKICSVIHNIPKHDNPCKQSYDSTVFKHCTLLKFFKSGKSRHIV